ncbi:ABC transporter ATP-binding protein [Philodulcilactobacillus myokoensis]|uniref:ABC transporter ATP-binding protein n=1 Tax=Philodulcilactobacillus myokoensis TaxID=2929573 RepID=A0A9W6ERL2_9LACO|nr:ABC transporter ATP-binding protein [Philodulcilactobacillus myokoensis]GLB46446.1 ABC transporter ATP-binding protein [Philodulcilactobacillus myokoensis]
MNILEIKNLNQYYGRKQILHNISFNIKPGSIVGLIGPNGAGKSTIMKSIVGLINYSSGLIKINDYQLTNHHRDGLKDVGSMIETPAFYPNLTGRQHLQLFKDSKTSKRTIHEIIHDTQIENFVDQKVKKYSLGMKQRMGIALTLLNHPKLLILDEPMNGLDPEATRDLRQLLLNFAKRGISILISSHLLDELERIADYYVVINHGQIEEQASAHNFLSSQGTFINVKTENNLMAIHTLQKNDIQAKMEDKTIQIKDHDDILNQIMTILVKNKIKILSVQESHANLEESLLNLITKNSNQKEQ